METDLHIQLCEGLRQIRWKYKGYKKNSNRETLLCYVLLDKTNKKNDCLSILYTPLPSDLFCWGHTAFSLILQLTSTDFCFRTFVLVVPSAWKALTPDLPWLASFCYSACVRAKLLLSCLTLWDHVDYNQAPLSMGFSRQEYWGGLPCPPPEHLPDPDIEHGAPTLQAYSLSLSLSSNISSSNSPQSLHREKPTSTPVFLSPFSYFITLTVLVTI